MCERRGQTDLGDGDNSNQETKYACSVHDCPEYRRVKGLPMLHDDISLENENQRSE